METLLDLISASADAPEDNQRWLAEVESIKSHWGAQFEAFCRVATVREPWPGASVWAGARDQVRRDAVRQIACPSPD